MATLPPDRGSTDVERLVGALITSCEDGMRRGGMIDDGDANSWATSAIRDLCRNDPETAWVIMERLVDRTEDPAVLACVGAGPLEDLLTKHGGAFIDRLVTRIESDSKFAEMAGSVWRNLIPNDIWLRLQTALGRAPRELGF
jgi:hypothetical protein